MWRWCHAFLQERIQKVKKRSMNILNRKSPIFSKCGGGVMRFFRNASKKVKKRSMSKNGCRVQSWEDAPKKMYFSLLEKKKAETKKSLTFWNKKLVIYDIKWATRMATQFAPLQFKKRHHTEKSFFYSCFISFIDVITASTILQPCKSNHSSVSIFTSIIVYIKERKTTLMTH